MAYGEIKVDTITFTDGGIDKSVSISGLVQNPTFSGNITVTGTISGNTLRGQTVSGVTVTGTTAQFTSGTFTSITGTTATITSGVFASGTAAAPSVSIGTTDNGLYSPGGDQVAISTNGTGRLFVDASGRLLAGSSVAGDDDADNLNLADATNPGITLRGSSTGTGSIYFADGTTGDDLKRGQIRYSHADNALSFATQATEKLRITSDGKVGLGTPSVSGLFHAAGSSPDIIIQDTQSYTVSDGPLIQLQGRGPNATNYNFGYIRGVSSGSNDAGILQFATNIAGVQFVAMTIDSSQRVGIGTTNPAYKLDVNGTVNSLYCQSSGGGEFNGQLYLNLNGTTFAEALAIRGGNSGNGGAYVKWMSDAGTTGYTGHYQGITAGTGYDYTIYTETGLGFRVHTNGNGTANSNFYINPSGNVGIGTTSPSERLHVSGGNQNIRLSGSYAASQSNKIEINNGQTGVTRYAAGVELSSDSGGNYDSSFYVSSASDTRSKLISGTASNTILYTSNTERARIDSSGRLLVGTSTSVTTYKTEIVDDASLNLALVTGSSNSASNCPFLTIGRSRGSTASPAVVSSGDLTGVIDFRGYSGAASSYVSCAQITAAVDGTPDSGGDTTDMPGRLVFSTTADGASSPTERMRLNSNGYLYHLGPDFGATFQTAAGAGTTYSIITGGHTATSIASVPNACFRVWSNGDVVNTNNSYGSISDIKLKENIVDAGSQWDDLKYLQVRKYNFKEETGQQTHTQIGLIAQEVELVSPGLVSESPDLDEDGNDLGTVTKSVNYSVLYMKAVKALQEAMERIETLEQRLNDAGIA